LLHFGHLIVINTTAKDKAADKKNKALSPALEIITPTTINMTGNSSAKLYNMIFFFIYLPLAPQAGSPVCILVKLSDALNLGVCHPADKLCPHPPLVDWEPPPPKIAAEPDKFSDRPENDPKSEKLITSIPPPTPTP
jgi:hypothetical protein